MISKNLLTYTTLQRLETISSTLLQCIQRTLDGGIIFRAEVLQKKKKKKRKSDGGGRGKYQIVARKNSKASFLSLSRFFCICSEARRSVHTRLGERKGWKWSESPTFLSRSFVNGIRGCDGLLESSERGGGLDGAGGLVDRDLKAFRCKHPLLLANSAT